VTGEAVTIAPVFGATVVKNSESRIQLYDVAPPAGLCFIDSTPMLEMRPLVDQPRDGLQERPLALTLS
jgi:hypothetical protein